MESETIELNAADDLDEILSAPQDFTVEEAEAVIENIRRSREEWILLSYQGTNNFDLQKQTMA